MSEGLGILKKIPNVLILLPSFATAVSATPGEIDTGDATLEKHGSTLSGHYSGLTTQPINHHNGLTAYPEKSREDMYPNHYGDKLMSNMGEYLWDSQGSHDPNRGNDFDSNSPNTADSEGSTLANIFSWLSEMLDNAVDSTTAQHESINVGYLSQGLLTDNADISKEEENWLSMDTSRGVHGEAVGPKRYERAAESIKTLRSRSDSQSMFPENEPSFTDRLANDVKNITNTLTDTISEALVDYLPNSTTNKATFSGISHRGPPAGNSTAVSHGWPSNTGHKQSNPSILDQLSSAALSSDDVTSLITAETTTPFPGYISFDEDIGNLGDNLFSGSGGIVESLLGNFTNCYDNGTCLYGNNFTNGTILDGVGVMDVEPPPIRLWTLFLCIFPMFTVFGNVLVVMSVHKEKSLRTVTNYFIVSLAIADIMVAVLVMPLAVYVEVFNSFWTLGNAMCDTWVAFDVMCCTASILNLTAISVDRFIAVTQPLKYAKHKNSKRVNVMLALTWIISVAISSPIALGMNYTERRAETPNLCIFYNSDFLIYSSMGSFYIPCLIMVLLYWRIFRAIRLRARKSTTKKSRPVTNTHVIENKAQTGRTTSDASATEDSCHKELLPAGNSAHGRSLARSPIAEETSFTNYNAKLHTTTDNSGEEDSHSQSQSQGEPSVILRTPVGEEDGAHVIPNNKSTDFGPTSDENTTSSNHRFRDGESGYSAPLHVEVESNLSGNVTSPTTQRTLLSPLPRRAQMSPGVGVKNHAQGKHLRRNNNKSSPNKSVTKFNFQLNRHHSRKKKETGARSIANRRERKATKTLAIVLGVFLLCWVPFFTVNIMNAICIRFNLFDRPECNIDPMLFSFFVWLGYINSFLNPVIYTIFNIEFRRAFKKLLWEPCK